VSSAWKVPLVDLVASHRELEDELVDVFRSALGTARFIGGPSVEDFERSFGEFCRTQHCVGVSNGTDALRLALSVAGVCPSDSVITVPNTFIATTEAISQVGARPEFVDVDPVTYTMDPAKLRAYLENDCRRAGPGCRVTSKRTGRPVTAVVPVHLYGQMADMDPILELAEEFDLIVIEDACQSHGAEYFSRRARRWRRAGSMGRAAAFSFYPGKNLGACGEAGAITTNDEALARRCRMLRDHGQSRKYVHEVEGYNNRLDAIQAGILGVKLRRLGVWTEQRRECARYYDTLLRDAGGSILLPHVAPWSRPVYHLYVVRVAERDRVKDDLAAVGIEAGIHYPVPLHLSTPYESLGYRLGDYPQAEQAAAQVLSLPMFPELSPQQQELVAARLVDRCDASSEVGGRIELAKRTA
jgi:dTDP-4-amino-4,6-dideoxygalactose transaminase